LWVSAGRLSPRVVVGSYLGLTSGAVVVWFYASRRGLRTHANTLLFWRTVCDLGLAALIFG
jgi:hypothetical protein